jgi:hypothetical protein
MAIDLGSETRRASEHCGWRDARERVQWMDGFDTPSRRTTRDLALLKAPEGMILTSERHGIGECRTKMPNARI